MGGGGGLFLSLNIMYDVHLNTCIPNIELVCRIWSNWMGRNRHEEVVLVFIIYNVSISNVNKAREPRVEVMYRVFIKF